MGRSKVRNCARISAAMKELNRQSRELDEGNVSSAIGWRRPSSPYAVFPAPSGRMPSGALIWTFE